MCFRIVFFFLLFNIFFVNAFAVEGNNVVGFLVTTKEMYENEIGREADNTIKLLEKLGAKVVIVDYNALIKKQVDALSLDQIMEDFISENAITKVIIPGNYYNIDLPPYPPTQNRQLATESLVRLAYKKKIYLMGICGGMQGILHADGVKIVNVAKVIKKQNTKIDVNHMQSYPVANPQDLQLYRIRVNPLSNMARIIANNDLETDNNGWISIYLPHIHSEGIDSANKDNIDKLLTLGYNITGFADDGIIEIVEDMNGNVHLLSHPEILLIYQDKISFKDEAYKKSVLAMRAFISDFITKK